MYFYLTLFIFLNFRRHLLSMNCLMQMWFWEFWRNFHCLCIYVKCRYLMFAFLADNSFQYAVSFPFIQLNFVVSYRDIIKLTENTIVPPFSRSLYVLDSTLLHPISKFADDRLHEVWGLRTADGGRLFARNFRIEIDDERRLRRRLDISRLVGWTKKWRGNCVLRDSIQPQNGSDKSTPQVRPSAQCIFPSLKPFAPISNRLLWQDLRFELFPSEFLASPLWYATLTRWRVKSAFILWRLWQTRSGPTIAFKTAQSARHERNGRRRPRREWVRRRSKTKPNSQTHRRSSKVSRVWHFPSLPIIMKIDSRYVYVPKARVEF